MLLGAPTPTAPLLPAVGAFGRRIHQRTRQHRSTCCCCRGGWLGRWLGRWLGLREGGSGGSERLGRREAAERRRLKVLMAANPLDARSNVFKGA